MKQPKSGSFWKCSLPSEERKGALPGLRGFSRIRDTAVKVGFRGSQTPVKDM